MISRQVYRFVLEAQTPLYFGGTETGKLLTRAGKIPIVSGNAIGGLLRDWMKNKQDLLGIEPLQVMGDEEEVENKKDFRESMIQIDDGEITIPQNGEDVPEKNDFPNKVGTAIDPQTGAALSGQKYEHQYLPAGTKIQFEVSCNIGEPSLSEHLTKEKLQHLMSAWAAAIDREEVRWGGKKSLRFGVCKVKSIEREEFEFSSMNAIDDYLFQRRPTSVDKLKPTPLENTEQIYRLRMKGSFPYGVYMGDFERRLPDGNVSGEQQVSIPSSSLKGLIRHEVRRLVFKILDYATSDFAEKKAEQVTNRLFGSTDQAGIITFYDLQVTGQEVEVIRPYKKDKNDDFPFAPKYVKIDRITGGKVDTQLRTQREVQGDGEITLEIRPPSQVDSSFDLDEAWFPLIYVLRRIGSGQLPIGGRTSIGLGIFRAHELRVNRPGDDPRTFNVRVDGNSEMEVMDWLRKSYNRFKEWCVDGMEMD